MTIEEAKVKQTEAEGAMLIIAQMFEKQTGLNVYNVHAFSNTTLDGKSEICSVSLSVKL